jgi:hypothetical protein
MRYKVSHTKKIADTVIRGSKWANYGLLLMFVYDIWSLNFCNNKGPYVFIRDKHTTLVISVIVVAVVFVVVIIIIVADTIMIIMVFVQV